MVSDGLEVVDAAGVTHLFRIADAGGGARGLAVTTRQIEPGDSMTAFRIPLHPWDFGLGPDRLTIHHTYRSANADLSNEGLMVPPAEMKSLTFTGASGAMMAQVDFNGEHYCLFPNRLFRISSTYVVTMDKDFQADFGVSTASDMEVFGNELVVSFGMAEPVAVRTTGGVWTQNNAFQEEMVVVGDRLWRSENGREISSCTIDPENDASYLPNPSTQYAGDSTYPVLDMAEYGGVVFAGKANGLFQADTAGRFKNQTPQLARWPDARNCKGLFNGFGALWCPSVPGLLRIQPGESLPYGPERARRGAAGMFVHGGVEWGGALYLICSDLYRADSFIVKMVRDENGRSGRPYIYHEWAQTGVLLATATPTSISVSPIPTNPSLFIGYSTGTTGHYVKLGRGGGRDIDDDGYEYQSSYYVETGLGRAGEDMSVEHLVLGCAVVCDLALDETVNVRYSLDGGDFKDMLADQSVPASKNISNTEGLRSMTVYAAPGAVGQTVNIRIEGTSPSSNAGVDRPEIREAWLFGYLRPKQTDVVEVAVDAAPSRVNAIMTGEDASSVLKKLRAWKASSQVLLVSIPGYDDGTPHRFTVGDVQMSERQVALGAGGGTENRAMAMVALVRMDYGADYAA